MTRKTLFAAVLTLTCTLALIAQDQGYWRASSQTARAITGDVAFGGEKISINFTSYTIAQIRSLTPPELTALFGPDATGTANLYRTSIPAEKKFLHKNTLCGTEDTQWLATYVSGRTLQLAFFSGETMPVFTREAIDNATNLCGTYTYTR